MQSTKLQAYTSTVRITSLEMLAGMSLRAGQWVSIMGARGQYMGTTAQGTDVIRWQSESRKFGGGSDPTKDARANAIVRKYAKTYGAR